MAAIESSNNPVPISTEETRIISVIDDVPDAEHEHEEQGDQLAETIVTENKELQIEDLRPPAPLQEDAPAYAQKTNAASPKKGTMSAPTAPKANGGPPTPTVKKIINSGTFGAGSVKPTGPTTSTATKTAAPALKKPTTSAPTPVSKPALTSSMSSKPTATPSVSAVSRRLSVVPSRISAPPMGKPSLSASANAKPGPDITSKRNSMVSPSGSVGSAKAASATSAVRPRASVSEAVRKAPLASRPSVTSTAKPSTGPAKASTASRSTVAAAPKSRTTASISSIKEVKEESTKYDGKVAELQNQLEEATKTLELKAATVVDLEAQIKALEDSLVSASAEAESKGTTAAELETARTSAETQLSEVQTALNTTHEQLTTVTHSLETVQKELAEAKAAAASQSDLVQTLRAQIQDLEADLQSLREKIELLETSSAASAAEASSAERDALVKAQADLAAISEETNALKVAHERASKDSEARIAELQEKVAASDSLEAQITTLKAKKDENANKLSELEIEILELRESQEGLEDTRDTLQKRIASLENELAKTTYEAEIAAEAAIKKDGEQAQKLEELSVQHQKELEAASARYEEIVSTLEGLKTQHDEALAAHEQTKHDGLKREQGHMSQLQELEQGHAVKQATLVAEMDRISQELQNQESIYTSKVDSVKAEHAELLREAFERAKNEAAEAHGQELQALRSGSNSTMEQIQAASQIAIAELKAEHASQLESEVSGLNKQISKLNIELKATRDDLTKSKTALEALRAEVESLAKQRDDARAQAEAVPTLSPEHADEIVRLTKALSNTKDDLAATTDMLELTKSSMKEQSEKQSKELEEAAKNRADEILKVRSAHDAEISELATQKSELLISLSDLQGELATAKAALAAQATTSHKSNGSSHPPFSPGVTKEELTKMHEAHNLKIHDLQAEHEKAMNRAKEDLEKALDKIGELNQDLARKAMEIQYLEQDQDESQEQITRLKEDVDTLTGKIGNPT